MKKILISILALVAVTACNKEEIVDANPGDAIAFGNAFVDNATKAATDPSLGTTDKPLTAFNVWGTVTNTSGAPVAIFANDNVSGTVGENSTWNCTTKTQYWIEGAKYNFAALVNAVDVKLGANLLPEEVSYTADGSTDLLYAKSTEYTGQKAGSNVKVALTFEHLLSKAKFTVTNTTEDTDYSYSVTGIKITNTLASGTYTVSTEEWAATEREELAFGNIENVVKGTPVECASEMLLIPGEYTASVEFTVNLYYKNNLISTTPYTGTTAKTAEVNFTKGYAYNFNITVGLNDPIQFTVTTNPSWTNGGDITVE
ncbi:MAG: fimbrillin family protein [Bacteroidales bacterium]|nr:fimbrillin family protein [Bacteroidales bacterium]